MSNSSKSRQKEQKNASGNSLAYKGNEYYSSFDSCSTTNLIGDAQHESCFVPTCDIKLEVKVPLVATCYGVAVEKETTL